MRMKNRLELVAHRGAMLNFPENTLPAIQAALDVGARYVEFDLQMNADGEFVVIHDDDFLRTAGVRQSVLTADSKTCRSVSVHYPDHFADRFAPLPVSTLDEVMALMAPRQGCMALVEIKCESLEYWGIEAVMSRLLEKLKPYREQCVLISYSAKAIRYARQHSQLRTGWVLEQYNLEYRVLANGLKADYLVCNRVLIPDGEEPWPEFRPWMLYDIMNPEEALAYAAKGVELIETGDIEGMLSFFVQNKD